VEAEPITAIALLTMKEIVTEDNSPSNLELQQWQVFMDGNIQML